MSSSWAKIIHSPEWRPNGRTIAQWLSDLRANYSRYYIVNVILLLLGNEVLGTGMVQEETNVLALLELLHAALVMFFQKAEDPQLEATMWHEAVKEALFSYREFNQMVNTPRYQTRWTIREVQRYGSNAWNNANKAADWEGIRKGQREMQRQAISQWLDVRQGLLTLGAQWNGVTLWQNEHLPMRHTNSLEMSHQTLLSRDTLLQQYQQRSRSTGSGTFSSNNNNNNNINSSSNKREKEPQDFGNKEEDLESPLKKPKSSTNNNNNGGDNSLLQDQQAILQSIQSLHPQNPIAPGKTQSGQTSSTSVTQSYLDFVSDEPMEQQPMEDS